MDDFDKILRNKIAEAFDNHNEEVLDEDWDKMKKLLQKNKKRKAFVIWIDTIGKVAVFLIIAGLAYFIHKPSEHFYMNKSYTKLKNIDIKRVVIKKDTIEKSINDLSIYQKDTNLLVHNTNKNTNKYTDNKISIKNKIVIDSSLSELTLNVADDSITKLKMRNTVKNKDSVLAVNLDDFLEYDFDNSKQQTVSYAIETAGAFNFSNSLSGYAYSAGLNANYNINKNISLQSGFILNMQTFEYSTNRSNIFSDFLAYGNNEIIKDENLDARILAMDIPLNVSFRIRKIKFITGVSSILYLSENYTENSYYAGNMTKVPVKKTFSGFEPIRFFNLETSFKIGKKIEIQPFTKLPLKTTGYKDFLYLSGGIKLKYSFD